MLDYTFPALIQNAALLLAMAFVYDLTTSRYQLKKPSLPGQLSIGLALGVLGIIIMRSSWLYVTGIVFDTRSVLLCVSGLFFGTVPTAVAMAMTAAFRLVLGGAAAWTGVLVILATGSLGILWHHYRRQTLKQISWRELYLFGFLVHAVMLALMFTLPMPTALQVLAQISLPVLAIYPLATALLGSLMINRLRREDFGLKLQTSEERLRLALMAANQGLYDLNVQTGEAKVSPEYATMLGYDPAEFQETNARWIDRLHPDDHEPVAAAYRDYIAGKIPEYRVEFRQRTKAGDWKWILSLGKVVEYDAAGRPLRMLGTHTDITERKRNDAEKEKLQAQLLQSQKMEAVGRLAGGVAHDFNNMLQTILGYSELALCQVEATSPVHDELLEIRKAAMRSADLTRQLLAFARKQTVRPKILDLNDTVAGMLKMLQRLIGENIDLAWLPGHGLWPVKIDPSQLDQILANLAVNARDAIADTGQITIETKNISLDNAYCADHPDFLPGEYTLLAVSDNGCGMDQETLARIFEPYFTTKEQGKGTGLGLATVYGVVRQNNGFVTVYSEPGQGATVSIYLPSFAAEPVETEASPAEEPVGGTETILLVEDEAALLHLAKTILLRLGYTVLTANTPMAAIRLDQEYAEEIHLLITDVVMPEMNGRELAQRLSALRPAMQCLYMSGYTADAIAHHGVLGAGLHFIQKPFSVAALARTIRETLGGNPRTP